MSNNLNFFFDNSKNEDYSKSITINITSDNAGKTVRDIMRDFFSDAQDVPFEDVDDIEDEESVDTTTQIETGKNKKSFKSYIKANHADIADIIIEALHFCMDDKPNAATALVYFVAAMHYFDKKPPLEVTKSEFPNITIGKSQYSEAAPFNDPKYSIYMLINGGRVRDAKIALKDKIESLIKNKKQQCENE